MYNYLVTVYPFIGKILKCDYGDGDDDDDSGGDGDGDL